MIKYVVSNSKNLFVCIDGSSSLVSMKEGMFGGIDAACKSIGIAMDNLLGWIQGFMGIRFGSSTPLRFFRGEISLNSYSYVTTSKLQYDGSTTSFIHWSTIFKSNLILFADWKF